MSTITPQQAHRALFIDFEGNVDREPTLLGSYWLDGLTPRFEQYILEPEFHKLAERGLRSAMAADDLVFCSFGEALKALAYRAQREDRLLLAWSSRELKAIQAFLNDPDLVAWYEQRLIDAKKPAKRWKRRVHPDVRWKRRNRFDPLHSLERYQALVGYTVPTVHRAGRTGIRLRNLRARLQSGRPLTRGLKGHWTKLLNHNFHDCRSMREVTISAIAA